MLKHGAQTEADSGAWQIDVDENTVICDGVESVNIVATVTGASICWKYDALSFIGVVPGSVLTTATNQIKQRIVSQMQAG
jgi:hypothetical protein